MTPPELRSPFRMALVLSDAGHDVQIFLLGDATYLMRKATAAPCCPWAGRRLWKHCEKLAAKHIPIFA